MGVRRRYRKRGFRVGKKTLNKILSGVIPMPFLIAKSGELYIPPPLPSEEPRGVKSVELVSAIAEKRKLKERLLEGMQRLEAERKAAEKERRELLKKKRLEGERLLEAEKRKAEQEKQKQIGRASCRERV